MKSILKGYVHFYIYKLLRIQEFCQKCGLGLGTTDKNLREKLLSIEIWPQVVIILVVVIKTVVDLVSSIVS